MLYLRACSRVSEIQFDSRSTAASDFSRSRWVHSQSLATIEGKTSNFLSSQENPLGVLSSRGNRRRDRAKSSNDIYRYILFFSHEEREKQKFVLSVDSVSSTRDVSRRVSGAVEGEGAHSRIPDRSLPTCCEAFLLCFFSSSLTTSSHTPIYISRIFFSYILFIFEKLFLLLLLSVFPLSSSQFPYEAPNCRRPSSNSSSSTEEAEEKNPKKKKTNTRERFNFFQKMFLIELSSTLRDFSFVLFYCFFFFFFVEIFTIELASLFSVGKK